MGLTLPSEEGRAGEGASPFRTSRHGSARTQRVTRSDQQLLLHAISSIFAWPRMAPFPHVVGTHSPCGHAWTHAPARAQHPTHRCDARRAVTVRRALSVAGCASRVPGTFLVAKTLFLPARWFAPPTPASVWQVQRCASPGRTLLSGPLYHRIGLPLLTSTTTPQSQSPPASHHYTTHAVYHHARTTHSTNQPHTTPPPRSPRVPPCPTTTPVTASPASRCARRVPVPPTQ